MKSGVLTRAICFSIAVGACHPADDKVPNALVADLTPVGSAVVFRDLDNFSKKFSEREMSVSIHADSLEDEFVSCVIRMEFYKSGNMKSSYFFASWSKPESIEDGKAEVMHSVFVPHPQFDSVRLENIRCANTVKGRPVKIAINPEMWE